MAEVTSLFDSIRSLISEVSFSRVERASWMQSSRFERRIRASKDEVAWLPLEGGLEGLDVVVIVSSGARSVKLV